MAGLGELIVRVGANISEFTSAMTKVDHHFTKLGQQFSKVGGDAANALTKNLLGIAASVAGIGAVMNAVSSSFKLGDDLQRLSETVGATVEELDQLAIVASLNGASLEDLGKAFKNTNKSMVEAQDASSKAGKIYATLGIAVKDAQGNFRDTKSVLDDTIKALAGIENEALRTAVGTELLGKSFTGLAPTIRNYAEDTKRAIEITERFGSISTATATLTDALGDDLTALGEGGKRALLNAMVPAMEVARGAIELLSLGLSDLVKNTDMSGWAETLITVFGRIADSIRLIINLVEAFAHSLMAVKADMDVASAILNYDVLGNIDEENAKIRIALDNRNLIVAKANQVHEELWNSSGTKIEDALRRQVAAIQSATAARALPVNADMRDVQAGNIAHIGGTKGPSGGDVSRLTGLMDTLKASTKAAKDEYAAFAEKMATANLAVEIGLDTKTIDDLSKLYDAYMHGKMGADAYAESVGNILDADGKLNKEQDEINKLLETAVDIQRKGATAAAEYLATMQAEAGAIGLVGDALIVYNAELKKTAALEGITNDVVREAISAYIDQGVALEKLNEARKKSAEATKEGVKAGKDLANQFKEEIDAYGKTREEMVQYNVELKRKAALLNVTEQAQIDAINKEYDYAAALAKTADEMSKNAEHTKALATQFESLADSAVDWTIGLLEDSEATFKKMGEAFKKYVIKVILESTVKPFIISVLASVTGNAQAGGMANAANNPLGAIGQQFGFGGGGAPGASGSSPWMDAFTSVAGEWLTGATTSIGTAVSAGLFQVAGGAGAAQAAALAAQTAAFGAEGTALTLAALGAETAAVATAAAGTAATAVAGAAAVVPVIGWIIAAAILAYAIFAKPGGGPKEGGFATTGDVSGITGTDASTPPRWFTPGGQDSAINDLVTGTSDAFKAALEALGGKSGDVGFALGFDTDPIGDAPNRLHSGVFVDGQQIYNREESDLGRDESALTAALEVESQRSILAALQASEFPERIANILDSVNVSTASKDEIAKVINFATGMKQLMDIVAELPEGIADQLLDAFDGTKASFEEIHAMASAFASVADEIKALPEGLGERLLGTFDGTKESVAEIVKIVSAFESLRQVVDAGTPLDVALANISREAENASTTFDGWSTATSQLIAGFDGSTDAAMTLTGATQQFFTAAVALVQQIEMVKESMDTMFGDTIRSLTMQTLDPSQKYDFLQAETEALRALISTSADPEEIADLAQRVNSNIQEAFSLLSPEDQRARLNEFVNNIDSFNDEVNARLNAIETDVQDTVADVLVTVQAALDGVAERMIAAAEIQAVAADTQLIAANTPIVVITPPPPAPPPIRYTPNDVNG